MTRSYLTTWRSVKKCGTRFLTIFYFIFRDLVVGAIVRLPHSQVRELSIVSKTLFVFNFWVLFWTRAKYPWARPSHSNLVSRWNVRRFPGVFRFCVKTETIFSQHFWYLGSYSTVECRYHHPLLHILTVSSYSQVNVSTCLKSSFGCTLHTVF